jgi:hypothetical protein
MEQLLERLETLEHHVRTREQQNSSALRRLRWWGRLALRLLGRRSRRPAVIVLFVGTLSPLVTPAGAVPGITTRVSVDSAGNEENSFSVGPSISANGRSWLFRC